MHGDDGPGRRRTSEPEARGRDLSGARSQPKISTGYTSRHLATLGVLETMRMSGKLDRFELSPIASGGMDRAARSLGRVRASALYRHQTRFHDSHREERRVRRDVLERGRGSRPYPSSERRADLEIGESAARYYLVMEYIEGTRRHTLRAPARRQGPARAGRHPDCSRRARRIACAHELRGRYGPP